MSVMQTQTPTKLFPELVAPMSTTELHLTLILGAPFFAETLAEHYA